MGAKWAFRRDIGYTGDFMLLLFYHQGTGASLLYSQTINHANQRLSSFNIFTAHPKSPVRVILALTRVHA